MFVNLIKYSCHNYWIILEIVDIEVVLSLWGYREAKIYIIWKLTKYENCTIIVINAHTNMFTKDGPGSPPSKKVKASIGHHFIDYQTLY